MFGGGPLSEQHQLRFWGSIPTARPALVSHRIWVHVSVFTMCEIGIVFMNLVGRVHTSVL